MLDIQIFISKNISGIVDKWETWIPNIKHLSTFSKDVFKVLYCLILSFLVFYIVVRSNFSQEQWKTNVGNVRLQPICQSLPATLAGIRSLFFFVFCFVWFFSHFISHLLLAWERVVVTRHISHDGLLIWPQGANDICPGNRGRGERTEKRKMHKSKSVERHQGQQGAYSQEEAALGAQVISSLPAVG